MLMCVRVCECMSVWVCVIHLPPLSIWPCRRLIDPSNYHGTELESWLRMQRPTYQMLKHALTVRTTNYYQADWSAGTVYHLPPYQAYLSHQVYLALMETRQTAFFVNSTERSAYWPHFLLLLGGRYTVLTLVLDDIKQLILSVITTY